ncbi:MAG: RDD family protein [Chloroflexi bacterium]|nr:MAG: RDD family protein [Chloroflexota bacterium]
MSTTTMPAVAMTDKAGWWTRAIAIVLDVIGVGIVAGAVSSILGFATTSAQYEGISTLFQAAYFTYFWSAAGKGQTLGSRALKIRVVKTDGSYLDYVGAFLRYVGFIIACVVFLIGVIWAAFDAQKQGWHDKIASTYVVKA